MLLAVGVFLIWKFTSMGAGASGRSFWRVVGLLAASRIFTEAFHGDSAALPGGFRVAQVAGLIVLGGAMYMDRRWAAPDAASTDAPSAPRRSTSARRPPKPQVKRARSPRSQSTRPHPR
jgi:prolipoprotein diacylglyceryltransferase